MGHAYEAATSDAIARYARLSRKGEGAYFVTGADEHGEKIAKTAEKEGKEPIEICDKVCVYVLCDFVQCDVSLQMLLTHLDQNIKVRHGLPMPQPANPCLQQ